MRSSIVVVTPPLDPPPPPRLGLGLGAGADRGDAVAPSPDGVVVDASSPPRGGGGGRAERAYDGSGISFLGIAWEPDDGAPPDRGW